MTTTQAEILDLIDHATAPEKMAKKEALEFLGCLIDDLDIRREALLEEMTEESA
jgi:hypothetical protein